jgi:cyclic pyranopterin phosphate synthase
MNDVDFPVEDVLDSIETAIAIGFKNVKVNMVVKKGVNGQEILPMVEHFRNTGVILRFIEYMDVGNTNGWQMSEVLPSQSVIDLIHAKYPLRPISAAYQERLLKSGSSLMVVAKLAQFPVWTQAFVVLVLSQNFDEGKLFHAYCQFGL